MAITIGGTTAKGTTAGFGVQGNSTFTVTLPTYSRGQVGIIVAYTDQGTLSINQSWQTVTGAPWGTATPKLYIFYKVLSASETNPIITASGQSSTGTSMAACATFNNVHPATPIHVIGAATTGTGTPNTAAQITTTINNAWALGVVGRGDNESFSTETFGGSATGVEEQLDCGSANGDDAQVCLYTKPIATAGATGAGSAASAVTDPYVSIIISLTPGFNILVSGPTETDSAQAIGGIKNKALVQVTETETAQAIGRQKRRAVGQVTETETAQTILPCKTTGWIDGTVATGDWTDTGNILADDSDYAIQANDLSGTQLSFYLSDGTNNSDPILRNFDLVETYYPIGNHPESWNNFIPDSLDNLRIVVKIDGQEGLLTLSGFNFGDIYPGSTIISYAVEIKYYYDGVINVYVNHIRLKLYYQEPYHQEAPVVQVVETDSAQAVGRQKRKAITQVTESDSSQAVGETKYKSIAQVTEADTSQVIGKQKRKEIGQASSGALVNLLTNSYDWVDTNTDGLADDWQIFYGGETPSIVTGNGFSGNAQRMYATSGGNYAIAHLSFVAEAGKTYRINFKYRGSGDLRILESVNWLIDNLSTNTGNAISYTIDYEFKDNSDLRWYVWNTDDWIEIDEVEIFDLTAGGTGQSENAQAIGKEKRKEIAQVTETDVAQGLVLRVSQVQESDLSQPVGKLKSKSISQVSESDSALAIAGKKLREIALVIEVDTSQTVSQRKSKSITQTEENDSGQQIGKLKNLSVAQIEETNLSQSIAAQKLKTITQITEVDSAQSVGNKKLKLIQQVTESDVAQEITSPTPQLSQVNESDLAQPVGKTKRKSLCPSTSYEIACDPVSDAIIYYFFLERKTEEPYHLVEDMDYLSPDVTAWKIGESATPSFSVSLEDDGYEYAVGIVAENSVGVYSSMDVQTFVANMSIPHETDAAFGVSGRKEKIISQVSEAELAQIIGRIKRSAVAQVAETEFAQPVARLKRKTVAQVVEIDVANPIADGITRIEQVTENDIALPITGKKLKAINQVLEQDSAFAIGKKKQKQIFQTQETDEAGDVGSVVTKFIPLLPVFETDIVFPIRTFNPAKIKEEDLSVVMTNLLTVNLIVGDDIAAILSGYDIDANILQDTLEVIYETPYLQEQD